MPEGDSREKTKRMSCHEPVADRRVKASLSHPSPSGTFSFLPLSFSGSFFFFCHTRATTRVSRSKNKQINHLDYPIKSGNDRKEKVLLLSHRHPLALSLRSVILGLRPEYPGQQISRIITWMFGSSPNMTVREGNA